MASKACATPVETLPEVPLQVRAECVVAEERTLECPAHDLREVGDPDDRRVLVAADQEAGPVRAARPAQVRIERLARVRRTHPGTVRPAGATRGRDEGVPVCRRRMTDVDARAGSQRPRGHGRHVQTSVALDGPSQSTGRAASTSTEARPRPGDRATASRCGRVHGQRVGDSSGSPGASFTVRAAVVVGRKIRGCRRRVSSTRVPLCAPESLPGTMPTTRHPTPAPRRSASALVALLIAIAVAGCGSAVSADADGAVSSTLRRRSRPRPPRAVRRRRACRRRPPSPRRPHRPRSRLLLHRRPRPPPPSRRARRSR